MSSEKPPMYEPPQAGYQAQPGPPYPDQAAPPPGQAYPYQAPPPGHPYPQHPPQPVSTTVVVTQAGAGPRPGSVIRYGQSPALIVCQHCQATVTTSMDYESGLLTWLAAGGICLIGCWLGCCLIPFCIDPLKDVTHKCPNCHNTVGRFRHFS